MKGNAVPATQIQDAPSATATTFPRVRGDEPFFVVVNEGSGHGDAQQLRERLQSAIDEQGRDVEFFTIAHGQPPTQATRRALTQARAQKGILVIAGGDGTLNAACQVALGSGVPMAIIPAGTFNYFARSVGVPEATDEAIAALLGTRLEPIQVGLINDRVFLVNASMGLYPQLLEEREEYKQRYGRSRLVALYSALLTLKRAHCRWQLDIHSEERHQRLQTVSLLVDNNPLQLDHIGIDEAEQVRHGKLAAIVARPVSTVALYGLLLRGLISRLGEAKNIDSFAFREMRVALVGRRRRVKIATDGEILWLRSPLHFAVAPEKLPLLVPERGPSGETE